MNNIIILKKTKKCLGSSLSKQKLIKKMRFKHKFDYNGFCYGEQKILKLTPGLIIGGILDTIIPCTFGLIAYFMKNIGKTLLIYKWTKKNSKLLNILLNPFVSKKDIKFYEV